MTFLFIADIHGRVEALDRLPEAEVAVLGGDLTHFGGPDDVRRVLDLFAARYPRLAAVLGNCDPPSAESLLTERGVNLHLGALTLGGIVFAGLGGSNRTPFRTPYEWGDGETARVLGASQTGAGGEPLVVVSHAPPRGSGADRLRGGGSAGSEAVAAWVRSQRPALVLCGHIHEAAGEFSFDGIPVVNPGPFRDGRHALIELGPDGTVRRVELRTL